MNHTNDYENLKDQKAERRAQKKRPEMRKHGRNLKRLGDRGVLRIVKLEKKRK